MFTALAMDSTNEIFSWRVHPFRERIGVACFAVGVLGAMAWLAAELMQSLWWAVIAFLFLVASLNRFFLPSEFQIDDDGVSVRSFFKVSRLRWPQIRRFSHDEHGGFLSTRTRDSFFNSFQGIHLLFGENREAVVNRIRRYMNTEDAGA